MVNQTIFNKTKGIVLDAVSSKTIKRFSLAQAATTIVLSVLIAKGCEIVNVDYGNYDVEFIQPVDVDLSDIKPILEKCFEKAELKVDELKWYEDKTPIFNSMQDAIDSGIGNESFIVRMVVLGTQGIMS